MTSKRSEVTIDMQYLRVRPDGDTSDKTINQLAYGFATAPTDAIKRGGLLVIDRQRGEEGPSSEQSPQIAQVTLVTGARQHFHADRFANCDLATQ